MTVELFCNLFQLGVGAIAAAVAIDLALRKKTDGYVLAAGMLITFTMGNLYWFTYQLVTDQTPQIFYVSDTSWTVSYLFLLSMQLYVTQNSVRGQRHWTMYIPIPIGVALTLYFCQWGDILSNLLYMGTLTASAYLAIRNLHYGHPKGRGLHIFCILFVITEYALWLASCFWISDSWTNPYFWFDVALAVEIGCFLPMAKGGLSE